ncbi:hypothetical protein GNF18_03500 [Ligilactobacillus pobuzihii]|uniref:hypothetical protein n=1 Tax=Ligilactobacillus pobuzihii TaxID=449659 RepID=UPI0019D1716B|nr:hypothetical protein [Ligilactobacillus pobuzihii]MBN7274228.1 hypothetical protein [Ligilactobacillus pobuzihii]
MAAFKQKYGKTMPKKRVFLTINTAKLGVVFDGTKSPYQLKIQTFYTLCRVRY